MQDEAAEGKGEVVKVVDAEALEAVAVAALLSDEEEEEEGEEQDESEADAGGEKKKKKKKKKKGPNLLSKISGGRFGEGKFRAKMNLAGRKVFSATRGLGSLTHSLSAPVDIRARIAAVNSAMEEDAKYTAAKKALTAPLAREQDPEHPGEFLPPLVLVEPQRVLEHDVSFFTGDLNFRLRPLLAEEGEGGGSSGSGDEGASNASVRRSVVALIDRSADAHSGFARLAAEAEDDSGEAEKGAGDEDEEEEEEEDEPKDAKEHSSRKECKLAFEMLRARELAQLVDFDQLLGEQRDGTLFQEWDEMGIAFDPTYKYVPGSAAVYDSGEASGKLRMPAWCDRVMFSTRHRRGAEHVARRRAKVAGAAFNGGAVAPPALACDLLAPLHYQCPPTGEMVSDHRPVMAVFDIRELDKSLERRVRKKIVLTAEERVKAATIATLNTMRRAGGDGVVPTGEAAGWQY